MIPWIELPDYHKKELPEKQRLQAEHYHKEGYLIGDIIETDQVHNTRERLMDGWQTQHSIRKIATNPIVMDMLRMLYGREPVPFQTLNFIKGTEQPVHSDTIHFNTLTSKWMCGVWVALEDIGEDQGPLVYYPKSHKLPEYDYCDLGISKYEQYEQIMGEFCKNYEEKRLVAKKGQYLIWASNLLHGGSRIMRESTRFSQVTHYFFEDVVPYTPMNSNGKIGEYFVRVHTKNIHTMKPMKITLNGVRVFAEKMPNGLYSLRLDEQDKRKRYLDNNPDVKAAGDDPFVHYITYGHREKRTW